MNALDKAFIRAYAKGMHAPGAATVLEQDESGSQRAAASQNRAALEVARLSPLVEVSAADGVWYRIEQPNSAPAMSPHSPHFIPQPRAGRIPADAVRAAVESNLSAAEMLDSFLGLYAMSGALSVEPNAPRVRIDAAHVVEEPAPRAASAVSLLTPAELQVFQEGAAASVIAEVWNIDRGHEAMPESLCQCWVASEMLISPVVIEQSWIAPAQPAAESKISTCVGQEIAAPPAPTCEATPTAEVKTLAAPSAACPTPLAETRPPRVIKPKPPEVFQAAWEVDHLNWPEECDKLARGDAFGPLAKMLLETSRRGVKVIAVTGTQRGEGRTTLALCLARRVAKEGVKTALLDADFERPHLGRRIGIDMENGWDDVLTDDQPLSEAAVSSLEDNLTVLPLGRRAAAFVSAHTVTALQRASEVFDVVLVDMGPVREDEAGEPPVEGPSAAAALVVFDRRTARDEDLSQALNRLHGAGIEALGIVETFA
jgi:Mrp family chromosome partitioning ATPase